MKDIIIPNNDSQDILAADQMMNRQASNQDITDMNKAYALVLGTLCITMVLFMFVCTFRNTLTKCILIRRRNQKDLLRRGSSIVEEMHEDSIRRLNSLYLLPMPLSTTNDTIRKHPESYKDCLSSVDPVVLNPSTDFIQLADKMTNQTSDNNLVEQKMEQPHSTKDQQAKPIQGSSENKKRLEKSRSEILLRQVNAARKRIPLPTTTIMVTAQTGRIYPLYNMRGQRSSSESRLNLPKVENKLKFQQKKMFD